MTEASKSFNMGFDDVTSQRSLYTESDEAFSRSSIYKGSDETFSGSSAFKGSDETYDIFCVPCQEVENKLHPANAHCTKCEEHLCFDCCSSHRKNKTSRHHKLQDIHTMHQSKPVLTQSSTKIDKHQKTLSKPATTKSLSKQDKHRIPQSKPVTTNISSKTTVTSRRSIMKSSTPHEINIRSYTDNNGFFVTGIALLPDSKLAITESINKKVKLIETRHYKIVSEINFSLPWDVTYVQEGRLAVTLPYDKKIQFLTISSHTLSKERDISVNGKCRGIAYIDKDKTLIVTFTRPGKVEIISLSGEVIRKIEKDNTDAGIFKYPYYVVLTNDNTCMYVSDRDNQSITFLTLAGNVKSVYKYETLEYPRGLCVDPAGKVYVADGLYSTVYQLVHGTDKLQPLLDITQGFAQPWPLAYCDREDKLYVGMWNCDVVKVFQLE